MLDYTNLTIPVSLSCHCAMAVVAEIPDRQQHLHCLLPEQDNYHFEEFQLRSADRDN